MKKVLTKKQPRFYWLFLLRGCNFFRLKAGNSNYFEDRDQDGLANQEEQAMGTDPDNPDTDGDGYSDGVEVTSGYDPLIPAPNDRAKDDTEKTAISNPTTETSTNLTEKFIQNLTNSKSQEIQKINELSFESEDTSLALEQNQIENASITENDIQSIIEQTISESDTGVVGEMELIDESEINLLPEVEAENDDEKTKTEKDQIEEYLIQVAYILTENADYISGDFNSLSNELMSLIMGVNQDIEEGDDTDVVKLKNQAEEAYGKIKNLEVPYVFKNVHMIGLSLV